MTTARRFGQMIIRLQDHFAIRVTDWLVSGCLVSWGMALLGAPATVWADPVNSELAKIGSQTLWGATAMVLGLMRLGSLFVNGAVRRTPHLRAIGAFLTLFIWTQILLGLAGGVMPSVAAIFYPWLFVADLYNVYRAAQDAKFSDMRARALKGAAGDAASA